MKNPISPNKFFPVIITKQLEESKQFYVSLLNCSLTFESDWYIQLSSPKGLEIGLLIDGHPSQPDYLQNAYEGSGVVLSFEVADVDEEYKNVKATGLKIIYDIKTEEWGQRHFMLRDPNGMVVDVVQQPQE
ncbi:MAG: VOC family protein [Anaerolineae bacterium]|nr:VOC family protein [Anaerolineae bacterium]MCI0610454.1 VOC family protein [Anaerolineae bacterium]